MCPLRKIRKFLKKIEKCLKKPKKSRFLFNCLCRGTFQHNDEDLVFNCIKKVTNMDGNLICSLVYA